MLGLGDFENRFAEYDENGTVTCMDVEIGVAYGSCLHGYDLQHLGTQVWFPEPCPHGCETILTAEGYEVLGRSSPSLAA